MGTLYVVRHGQAAFGTEDYDRLTNLGRRQAHLLGQHFGSLGLKFDAVVAGTLTRHHQTAEAILDGASASHEIERIAALNEYDATSVVTAFTGEPPSFDPKAVHRDPETVRTYFRLLRDGLLAWAEGGTEPVGMPTFAVFQKQIMDVLHDLRQRFPTGNVLVSTSGGPVAAAVCAALEAPAASAVHLNLHVHNTAITTFKTTRQGLQLLSFNAIPHLDASGDPALSSYA
ncbi:histidine phosphatase family protein [Pigmentiphaga aceris]|uniref:Histidine phosphatase family protein n=1 Tax=Pigmentiphaga aceris TaxID=1940612 RepID=A0A5C0B230_9BURK|nr:histidine phosphatase family protein [Pigmentiphaga aceris]QEI06811.1 histidine phosphatase family protein [Pigmentiphaga aceris]